MGMFTYIIANKCLATDQCGQYLYNQRELVTQVLLYPGWSTSWHTVNRSVSCPGPPSLPPPPPPHPPPHPSIPHTHTHTHTHIDLAILYKTSTTVVTTGSNYRALAGYCKPGGPGRIRQRQVSKIPKSSLYMRYSMIALYIFF